MSHKIYWWRFRVDTISGSGIISEKEFNHTMIVDLGITWFCHGYYMLF
jgi:hypothetical protein